MTDTTPRVSTDAITEITESYTDLAGFLGIRPAVARIVNEGVTTDPSKVDVLLGAVDGPLALALGALYLRAAGIAARETGWSVSCLPTWARTPPGQTRAMTIAIGQRESAWVWLDKSTGRLASWGVLIAEPEERRAAETIAEQLNVRLEDSDRGVYLTGSRPELFVLDDPTWSRAASIAAARLRAQPRRRDTWHNARLAQTLLGAALAEVAPGEHEGSAVLSPEPWEFERRYVETTTKRRLHQGPLRDKLLATTRPVKCRICEVTQVKVLQAAHIIGDADGGAASSDNLLLLCANHHVAMDAGLFAWDRRTEQPVWNVDPF